MAAKPTPPPPAYFLSLSLENVRSFGEKQTISFAREDGRPAQWTIILGDNGVGKTTVLKSLAAVSPLEVGPPQQRYYSMYFTRIQLNYNWLLNKRENNFRSLFEGEIILNNFFNEKKNVHKQEIENFELEVTFKDDGDMKSGSSTVFSHNANDSFTCYAYGAGRTVGNSTLTETPKVVDAFTSLFNDRADLLNPEEWFLQMEYSSLKQDKQAAKSLEQVRQVLLQVLPDVADIRINSKGHQQYLELETPYGWVRLRDMSLGYQTLVVWLTDFASKLFIRYPDSPNPLEEPAIVLIDEIDLHLHPSWQRKLIKFLSEIFINTQFIATAHSPLVVQAAGDAGANVVLLRREGDQTVVVTDVEDVRGWRLDQILTSELFGLETARSLDTEKLLKRRAELLSQTALSPADKQDLTNLTEQLGLQDQPVGETPSEKQVHAVLRQLRQKLGKQADA